MILTWRTFLNLHSYEKNYERKTVDSGLIYAVSTRLLQENSFVKFVFKFLSICKGT